MSGNVIWQKSFDLSFSVERVWSGYFEFEGSADGAAPPVGLVFTIPDTVGTRMEITEVVERERLSWKEEFPTGTASMTMVFEATETGTRISVTRYGFGEGDEFDIFRESHPLGWLESIQDLALFLRTGVRARRHLEERSATGVLFKETEAGLEVRRGGNFGLERDDLVISVNGAGVYTRADLWLLTRLLEPGTEIEVGFIRDDELRTGRGPMLTVESAVSGELGLGPREEPVNTK